MAQKSHLNDYMLKSAKGFICNYLLTLTDHMSQIDKQTNQLKDFNQRLQLVTSANQAANINLLSASHAACQVIYHVIHHLHVKLIEIADCIDEFDRGNIVLENNLHQNYRRSSIDWSASLFQTLNVLQTQAKYLEWHVRLLPPFGQISAMKHLEKYLQLTEQFKFIFCTAMSTELITGKHYFNNKF